MISMEHQQAWRLRFSFRNATILVCFFNLVAVLLLLQGFISVSNRRISRNQPDPGDCKSKDLARRLLGWNEKMAQICASWRLPNMRIEAF